MTLELGASLRVRALVYVAGERIPFFWPMRGFIHHNPLHGFEHMPFEQAVEAGAALFHARVFPTRMDRQRALAQGEIDGADLDARIAAFAAERPAIPGVDLARWLRTLARDCPRPLLPASVPSAAAVAAVLAGREPECAPPTAGAIEAALRARLLDGCPPLEAMDALYGSSLADTLDELTVKSCLDFFDEGQSVWGMPGRSRGFYYAWRDLARRNLRFLLRGLRLKRVLDAAITPEAMIVHVMRELGVPEEDWQAMIARELARLHGWAGFVRWRAQAARHYWAQRYPADLVDFLAVRLALGLALLRQRSRGGRIPFDRPALAARIASRPAELALRVAFHDGTLPPGLAAEAERALARGHAPTLEALHQRASQQQQAAAAQAAAAGLKALAIRAGQPGVTDSLDAGALASLLDSLAAFEQAEGMIWLHAAESRAVNRLLDTARQDDPPPRPKRPFAQALFCIDTRSERIRRHLEGAGDYQTFGLAGFFGVPVSHMALGHGSETALCPVILTPKNVVPELSLAGALDTTALSALEKTLHELKESVFSPFATVEAVGLLFGFDMVGKTVAPRSYLAWRKRMHARREPTRLLIDKFSRDEADSIVRAVQRALIVKAVRREFNLEAEHVSDDKVRELREAALAGAREAPGFAAQTRLDAPRVASFLESLRRDYRINRAFADAQMEQLARIGFTLDEQVGYVGQTLRAIGLTGNFSRFVLLVGHGSHSENNPYESALDCGACGGNHGLVSARVLAAMANKPGVRRRLREQGIDIPGDVWFVPALHDTTSDAIALHDLDLLPSSHLVYLDRLREGLTAASRLTAAERLPALEPTAAVLDPQTAAARAARNALDWSQTRPEWGLSRNAWFVIGRRQFTRDAAFDGRAFLHSYDWRLDPKRRLLESILTGPLVVGQWINMEHYFSAVDNERFGSGSKVYHNVAGRFGVMTGNLSDLRTGLPAQTVLKDGVPYHEPLRLVAAIEAPLDHARRAVEGVVAVKRLVHNGWIRLLVIDPETRRAHLFEAGAWHALERPVGTAMAHTYKESA